MPNRPFGHFQPRQKPVVNRPTTRRFGHFQPQPKPVVNRPATGRLGHFQPQPKHVIKSTPNRNRDPQKKMTPPKPVSKNIPKKRLLRDKEGSKLLPLQPKDDSKKNVTHELSQRSNIFLKDPELAFLDTFPEWEKIGPTHVAWDAKLKEVYRLKRLRLSGSKCTSCGGKGWIECLGEKNCFGCQKPGRLQKYCANDGICPLCRNEPSLLSRKLCMDCLPKAYGQPMKSKL